MSHLRARPQVDNRYRTQAVDLQPYGNTISVEADSDNPFEDDRDVEVYTQLSGGMTLPDAKQRSKKIMTRPVLHQKQTTKGVVKVHKVRESAHRQGFMPGFGDLPNTTPNIDQDEANPPGFTSSSGSAPMTTSSSSGPSFLSVLQAAITGGSNAAGAALGARTAQSQAQIAQSNLAATNARNAQMAAQANGGQAHGGTLTKYLPWALGAAAVVAVGAILLGKRSAAPKTNPRRRR